MTDYVAQLLGAGAAGGGFVGALWAVLKFAGSRNELSKKQIDDFIAAQERVITALRDRVAYLEKALKVESDLRHSEGIECRTRLMDMQRTIGGLEATLQRLETAGVAATVVADSKGTITEWNEGATILFGWGRSEALGQQVTILVPLKLRDEHERAFGSAEAALTDPATPLQARVLESYALRRDGAEVPVTITLRGWMHDGRRMYSAEIRRR